MGPAAFRILEEDHMSLALARRLSLCLVATTLAMAGTGGAETGSRIRVALTFDDLPVHSALPAGMTRADVATSVLTALAAHHAPPTYGFVNAKNLVGPGNAEVLRLWRAAGHPLASHTFSHIDLNANTTEAFEQDVLANEKSLRTYMGKADWHWLRYPYLHEGDTIEKRRAVRQFLKDHSYKVAQVTLNFDDWAFNDPYARCLAKNDQASVEWLKETYVRRASDALSRGPETARLIYGHDIAHVLLLHIGAFETVMLPRLLDLLDKRGFQLVTLPEAQSDPAYAIDPDVPFPGGATLLDQMKRVRQIQEPDGPADDTLAKVGGLCP
jgi:peptidoglycan-N-acetylglucosamine deacetylase